MSRHIDAHVKEEAEATEKGREAEISRTEEKGAFGVPVFLTADELEELGVDPDDTAAVVVRVEDGFVLFDPASSE